MFKGRKEQQQQKMLKKKRKNSVKTPWRQHLSWLLNTGMILRGSEKKRHPGYGMHMGQS